MMVDVKPKVIAAYCQRLTTSSRFMTSWDDLRQHDRQNEGYITGRISLYSGPRIAEARSQIVDEFAKGDGDWLFMVDDDMTFAPDALARLMASADPVAAPVVGGLCFAGVHGGRIYPTVYEAYDEEGHLAIRPVDAYPEGLVKVGATGAAAMLVHRNVFARLRVPGPAADEGFDPSRHGFGTLRNGQPNPFPWFEEGQRTRKGIPLGEDVAFCRKLLLLGIPIYVDTTVKFGHCKEWVITEASHRDYLRERDRPGPLLSAALAVLRESGRFGVDDLDDIARYLEPRRSLLSDQAEKPKPIPFVLPEPEPVPA